MTPDVNVVLIDFKNTKPNEMVTENEDGSFTIFLNSRLFMEILLLWLRIIICMGKICNQILLLRKDVFSMMYPL